MPAITPESVVDDLLAKVEQLRPLIESHIETNERERRLAPAVVEAFRDAGLFQLVVPKSLGGLELDPVSGYRVVEAVARIDGASGWCVGIAQAWGLSMGMFSDQAVAETFPDRRAVVAGAGFPPGALTPVEGGFRFSGRHPFASGCHHAKTLLMIGMVMDGGQPAIVSETGAPDVRLLLLPAADITIHDTWDTFGMRGTGSHDIEARDAFVPAYRVGGAMGVVQAQAYNANAMYRVPQQGVHYETVTSLGVAQAAIDYLIALAPGKVPAIATTSLRDRASAQSQVAEAQAIVDAARASLHASVTAAMGEAERNGAATLAQKMTMQLAANFAADGCARAVELVWAAAGTSGIRMGSPLQRYFRDIRTLSQHTSKSLSRYESVGRAMFGLESDWPYLTL